MKNKKRYFTIACMIIVGLIGLAYFLNETALGATTILPKPFTDLIGTRTASSTIAVNWYGGFNASTTYPFSLLGSSEATVVFDITDASTTGAQVAIALLGSNDPQCGTATTSTTADNQMLKSDIRWFDAGAYLDNAAVTSSFNNSTTTISWINPQRLQRALKFTKLNMNCLAIEVNASSTSLYAQHRLKN